MILEKEEKSRQEQERELLEQEVRIYENQFGIIRQSQQNIRALKHDMKHHIKNAHGYGIWRGKRSSTSVSCVYGAFMENSGEYVATGNEKIDSILMYGFIISLVTLIIIPPETIWFGILNFMGCAVLLMFPLRKAVNKVAPAWGMGNEMSMAA